MFLKRLKDPRFASMEDVNRLLGKLQPPSK